MGRYPPPNFQAGKRTIISPPLEWNTRSFSEVREKQMLACRARIQANGVLLGRPLHGGGSFTSS